MTNKSYSDLFDSCAVMSLIVEKSTKMSIELIKNDIELSSDEKKEAKEAIKKLIFYCLELQCFVGKKNPELDFMTEGNVRYEKIREKARQFLNISIEIG